MMKATDLIAHGCTPSVAAGAIAALRKQSDGKPLSEFEQGLITMATPAMTAYRRAGLMWITQNPRFGQLYVEHNGLEYRVPRQKVTAFLTAIDLAEVPADGIEHYSEIAGEALAQCAELTSAQRIADAIVTAIQTL